MLPYLAIGFLLLIVATIFYGFSMMMRRPPSKEDLNTESCTLCRNRFDKKELVEREVGDYKVLYFCRSCIAKLQEDLD